MSDSLNATVIVSLPELMISAKPVLLDDDDVLDPPRLPALVVPVPALALAAVLELAALLEPLEETLSPGEMSSTDTTVPVAGAYRCVSSRAVSAVWTVASAPSTEASAEAMFAAIVAALVVLVPLEAPEPEPEPEPVLEPEPVESLWLESEREELPRSEPPVAPDPLGVVVVVVVGVEVVLVVVGVVRVVLVAVVVVVCVGLVEVVALGW
jgi:hypothetical protein